MTTIAYDGKTVAVDSRMCQGSLIISDDAIKYRYQNGKLFFLTGATNECDYFAQNFCAGEVCAFKKMDAVGILLTDGKVFYVGTGDDVFFGCDTKEYKCSLGSGERFALAANSISFFNKEIDIFGSDSLAITGSIIKGHGIVSDEKLNYNYNITKFYLATSYNEGLCLPMIESLICGCIPITCLDMTTASEFIPEEFLTEPNQEKIAQKINSINQDYNNYQKIALSFGKKYSKTFNKITIAQNILNLL